jgi:A/G-specific adenine glycosylase
MDGIGKRLVTWYMQHHRQLPWRETTDPYLIWLSEIILQQTQVVTGEGYYHRIAQRFPTVAHMASAPLDELLRLWQGMGYYSRARNMHFAAQQVVNDFGGQFPNTYVQLATLKGVGPYTAAAIASIAFNLPHAVVDGNVFRVLSRLYAIDTPIDSTLGKKTFNALANQLLDATQPALHNQAMMELGALVCKAAAPLCHECPLADHCLARQANAQLSFPVKAKKVKAKSRFLYYILVEDGQNLLTKKRVGSDIWQGLYELPLFEGTNELSDGEIAAKALEMLPQPQEYSIQSIERLRHLLTHQVLQIGFIHLKASQLASMGRWDVTRIGSLASMAFPKPIVHYLDKKMAHPSK